MEACLFAISGTTIAIDKPPLRGENKAKIVSPQSIAKGAERQAESHENSDSEGEKSEGL
jgi:hypothetical protein